MNVIRVALFVLLIVMLALTGCRSRGATNAVVGDELCAENQCLIGVVIQF